MTCDTHTIPKTTYVPIWFTQVEILSKSGTYMLAFANSEKDATGKQVRIQNGEYVK